MFGSVRIALLLLAAIVLTGCAVAAGGEQPRVLPANADEEDTMSDKATAEPSEVGVPALDDAEATKTKTATFALG